MTFSQMILNLQNYWQEQGCAIMQPYDMPAGAGTFHPATFLRSLGKNLGQLLMWLQAEGLLMDVMVKIPIA